MAESLYPSFRICLTTNAKQAADVTPFLLETHPSEDILKSQIVSTYYQPKILILRLTRVWRHGLDSTCRFQHLPNALVEQLFSRDRQ